MKSVSTLVLPRSNLEFIVDAPFISCAKAVDVDIYIGQCFSKCSVSEFLMEVL